MNPKVSESAFYQMHMFLKEGSTPDSWEVDYTKATVGWLTFDGVFYPCGFTEHVSLADELGIKEGVSSFFNPGDVLHIYDVSPSFYPYYATDAQVNVLFELAKAQGKTEEFQKWVEARDQIAHHNDNSGQQSSF
jgi:hypothetical protein